jgi:hypothetical protein
MDPIQPAIGMIKSRECPTCGHHEIGYVDSNNTFHALKPNDMVQVLEGGMVPDVNPIAQGVQPIPDPTPEEVLADLVAWVPDPIRSDKALRLKFGVLVSSDMMPANMSAGFYGIAYRQKLHHLIEEEKFTPLPLILDRYFGAPHLASGDPIQIIESLMGELDELQHPLELVQNWLQNRDDDSLSKLIHPKSVESLGNEPIDDEQLKQELYTLTLEEFLEML